MAAADVKAGGTDILPDVDDLDVDSGIGYSAPKSRSLRRSAHDGHAYHRGDDSQATQDELRKSAQHIGLLSARDDAVQKAADEAAEHDLDSYNTGISASLDDYARISKSIDAQSRSVFNPKPKKHVKPAVDPFKDDESVWHQMGVPSHRSAPTISLCFLMPTFCRVLVCIHVTSLLPTHLFSPLPLSVFRTTLRPDAG